MADPLSVAGLALAVVSLGLQVTGGITDYFDSLKSRDQDIASIIQQNDTLKKTLQVIESSISRFQNDHRTATEALRQFLDSSNDELKVLEGMVATLTTNDQGATDRRTKARNKGKKLLYPFHRPKLEQMATKLHHINATLQLGLQSLGLSVSHLGSEKLATLQVTSQTISSDLLVVQSEVSSISSPIRGMQSTLSQFETRFDGLEHLLEQLLVQGSNTNEKLQDITPALVTGRLLGKPAVLREMCDAVVTQERHKPKRKPPVPHETAARVSTGMSSYSGGRFSCLCRHRRHVQRWNAALGSFVLSHETTTERHLPGCPVTRDILEPDRTQKLALTYAGLRRLLNSAIQFSLTIRSGAGGSSFGPNFTYYPIVDSNRAPAFKMLHLLMNSFCHNRCLTFYGHSEIPALWEKLVPSVVSAVLSLLQAKKASPRAVNDRNESLVYSVALCIGSYYRSMRFLPSLARTSQASPLLDLLEYLVNNKAPANNYNTYGNTPLSALFASESYGSVTYPVPATAVDLILRSNTDSAAVNRRYPDFPYDMETVLTSGKVIWLSSSEVLLHFLSSSTRIADAYGCGVLSLAILSNNLEEVKVLITNHPSTLSERNLFGQTPLHLAAGKPSILRVLIDAADIALLNLTDAQKFSALDLAVSVSGRNCREGRTRKCKGCRCTECAVILMKADCMIRNSTFRHVRVNASKRCKLRYLRYMKGRRDRLKRLALENLPKTDIEELCLESKHVLDSDAFEVTKRLQQTGICVPEALAVEGNESFRPIYQLVHSCDDADLLFRAGFRDTASWCDADDVENWDISPLQKPLSYLGWLANHDGIYCRLPFPTVKDIFGSACIFSAIGDEIRRSWTRSRSRYGQYNQSNGGNSPAASLTIHSEEDWYHEVHSAVFEARAVDSCSCQCSPGGCNMLTFILRQLVNERDYKYKPQIYPQDDATTSTEDPERWGLAYTIPLLKLIDGFIIYLSHFSCHFRRWHHYAAIRFLTFAALEISHCCCRTRCWDRVFEDDVDSNENGLGDDQGYKLALLEDLINEFEETMSSVLENPDTGTDELIEFWERAWVGRMSEVLDRLEGCDLPEDEKLAAEEIGVVWDKVGPEPPEPRPDEIGNPYDKDMVEYWLYELRKIEEECQ
ncbi:uncharacterized protein FPRO_02076 [Fusarium proliferatum ET1]|uniref:Uncharacterized protein n=1 Tax=Fusarium proliferatum (strain ET1) TaxID=1227346 RepID=A0A1L7UYJ0_FUSPR|nr:uncharacterized protein FPRO_02076 [Fusarium proliferatum ET1]CZR32043.1 uncharacterized protein FPRO_02076 [Fusarium proliferatum ET1]